MATLFDRFLDWTEQSEEWLNTQIPVCTNKCADNVVAVASHCDRACEYAFPSVGNLNAFEKAIEADYRRLYHLFQQEKVSPTRAGADNRAYAALLHFVHIHNEVILIIEKKYQKDGFSLQNTFDESLQDLLYWKYFWRCDPIVTHPLEKKGTRIHETPLTQQKKSDDEMVKMLVDSRRKSGRFTEAELKVEAKKIRARMEVSRAKYHERQKEYQRKRADYLKQLAEEKRKQEEKEEAECKAEIIKLKPGIALYDDGPSKPIAKPAPPAAVPVAETKPKFILGQSVRKKKKKSWAKAVTKRLEYCMKKFRKFLVPGHLNPRLVDIHVGDEGIEVQDLAAPAAGRVDDAGDAYAAYEAWMSAGLDMNMDQDEEDGEYEEYGSADFAMIADHEHDAMDMPLLNEGFGGNEYVDDAQVMHVDLVLMAFGALIIFAVCCLCGIVLGCFGGFVCKFLWDRDGKVDDALPAEFQEDNDDSSIHV